MARIGEKEKALRAQRERSLSVVAGGNGNGGPSMGPMTKAEAKAITARINYSAGQLCDLLLEAHDREAWKALGYGSWREYASAEFTISQSRAYQLLTQAVVKGRLREASNSTNVEIAEGDARLIRPALDEVAEEVRERVEAGDDPQEAVSEVVEKYRPAKQVEEAPDPVKEWERTAKELEQAQDTIRSLQSSDLQKEVAKLAERCARLEGRLSEATSTKTEAERSARGMVKRLREIANALGVQDFEDILPAIQDLRR